MDKISKCLVVEVFVKKKKVKKRKGKEGRGEEGRKNPWAVSMAQ